MQKFLFSTRNTSSMGKIASPRDYPEQVQSLSKSLTQNLQKQCANRNRRLPKAISTTHSSYLTQQHLANQNIQWKISDMQIAIGKIQKQKHTIKSMEYCQMSDPSCIVTRIIPTKTQPNSPQQLKAEFNTLIPLCKIFLLPQPTFLILGTLMQHVVLCQMENRVFFIL